MIRAESIVHFIGIPIFEFDDELHFFLIADGADAVELRYVDNAQSPYFHVVADKSICTLSEQDIAVDAPQFDDVVRNEAMAPFYEFERGFAFTDTGVSDEQYADAVHFDEDAVHRFFRREGIR